MDQYEAMKLIVSIVERGKCKELIELYHEHQVYLNIQCIGRGTATSEILDILGLDSSEKDILISCATQSAGWNLLYQLDDELRGSVNTSGIVFMLPMTGINNLIAAAIRFKTSKDKKGLKGGDFVDKKGEHSLILVTCNRGYADKVMSTATKAGARGGTVVKARWTGMEDVEASYDLNLAAEKEMIVIVVSKKQRNEIMDAINAEHGLKSKSQSMISSLPIDEMTRL